MASGKIPTTVVLDEDSSSDSSSSSSSSDEETEAPAADSTATSAKNTPLSPRRSVNSGRVPRPTVAKMGGEIIIGEIKKDYFGGRKTPVRDGSRTPAGGRSPRNSVPRNRLTSKKNILEEAARSAQEEPSLLPVEIKRGTERHTQRRGQVSSITLISQLAQLKKHHGASQRGIDLEQSPKGSSRHLNISPSAGLNIHSPKGSSRHLNISPSAGLNINIPS
jgi:hypothetical protein